MTWLIGSIIGSICLVTVNTLQRHLPLTFCNAMKVFPLLILCSLGYWFAYRTAGSFLAVWFTGTGLVTVLAIVANVCVLGEAITPNHVAGIGIIVVGCILLNWR